MHSIVQIIQWIVIKLCQRKVFIDKQNNYIGSFDRAIKTEKGKKVII
jgi:hypothetical protein